MFRIVLTATAACALAGLSATAAEAAHFSFNFTAPTQFCYWDEDSQSSQCYAGDTASGAGFLDADDNGDGSFTVTNVTGDVHPWDGADAWQIVGFGGGDFLGLDTPTIDFANGSYQLGNLGLAYQSPWSTNFLGLSMQGDGTIGGIGEDFAQIVNGTFVIAPAAAVPEVATWGLMLMGFGATGFAMRRRRSKVTFA